MARKVIDITNSANRYDIISQTPKNYDKDNYFLKELQDKINAEWRYRPNRVDVEYEHNKDNIWYPLEVVAQTVRSEKGTAISEDCIKLVFRDISESRFKIGSKFRFSPNYDLNADFLDKDVWLVTNTTRTSMTPDVVIERCNGILGSTYIDQQGLTQYHYEPVIQGKDLSSVSLFYNETAVSPQSQLLIIAQYNEFTCKYKINQRFIIGARQEDPNNAPDASEENKNYIGGQVYRVKALNKFYANSTHGSEDVGLIRIYLELTETSVYDNWNKRIAYQQDATVHIDTESSKGYSLILKTPEKIPTDLTSEELLFTPMIIDDKKEEKPDLLSQLHVSFQLENWPSTVTDPSIFIGTNGTMVATEANGVFELQGLENGVFTLKRNRIYLNGDLIITCWLPPENSPTGEVLKSHFSLVLRRQEA